MIVEHNNNYHWLLTNRMNIALGSFQTSDAENEHAHEHYPKRRNFLHHIMISFSRNCYEY